MLVVLISLLECLVLLPISFTILQFFIAPDTAFAVSITMCLLSILACLIGKLKTNIYISVSTVVSFVFSYIAVQRMSVVTFIVMVFCYFIFAETRSNIYKRKDLTIEICAAALLSNIVLSLIKVCTADIIVLDYSNLTIAISTICCIILLIFKQMNSSRKFGKNNMRIGTTQRKNNRIFALVSIGILLMISATGQVSNIYKLILKLFRPIGWFKIKGSASGRIIEKIEPSETSPFWKSITEILRASVFILIVSLIILGIFLIAIYIIKRIRNPVSKISEDGHVDEKESLIIKNLSQISKRLLLRFNGVFDRETPYNKLPNDIAKLRRLFRNYKNKAQKDGVQISKASTSKEICQDISKKAPETKPFNDLLQKCYSAARYGEVPPLPQEFLQLESKLRK